jgi:hypothetical protein
MAFAQAATILVKLCFFGPVLYLGLLMAIDPASTARLLETFIRGMHNFEHALRRFPWQEPLRERKQADVSEGGGWVGGSLA